MSVINTQIKPFKANAYKNGKFIEVTDQSLKGKWSVVVFYPADFTFVCPTELEDLADHYDAFQKLGVEIYSVSTDTHFAHKAWHDTSPAIGKVKYTMVGDPTTTLARNFDVLIVDTAGRLHTQEHLMRELTKIRDVVAKRIEGAPHEVLLVLDATTGQNAIQQAHHFGKAINVTGIVLAKLDGTAKGGVVLSIKDQLNIPVKFIGLGETPEDIETFDPQRFVDALLGEPAAAA